MCSAPWYSNSADLGGAPDRPDVTDEEGEADHPFGDVEQDPRFARKRTAASAGRMMKMPANRAKASAMVANLGLAERLFLLAGSHFG